MSEIPPGFKPTELGPVPEDWEVVKLEKVLTEAQRPEKVDGDKEYRLLGVRWYAMGPFEKDRTKGKNIKAKKLYIVREGDFIYNRLFAWKGSFGVIPPEMTGSYVSGEFPVFESDREKVDVYFLWRYFSQPWIWRDIESQSTGSTKVSRLRYKKEQFLNLKIPLPPLPEQERIAFVLSTIQEDIERTDRVIEAAKELKKSMMKHLFTYGPVPVHEKESVPLKETEIGMVPEEWDVVKLKDATETVTDYVANGSFASLKENVKYKNKEDYAILLRLVDYSNKFKGPFVYIDKNAYEFLSKTKLKHRDIILSNVGARLGTVFRVPDLRKPMSLGPNSILIRARDSDDYFFYWLKSDI